MVGRWLVGGRPTTYWPLFYGAACSRLPTMHNVEYMYGFIASPKPTHIFNIQYNSTLSFNIL